MQFIGEFLPRSWTRKGGCCWCTALTAIGGANPVGDGVQRDHLGRCNPEVWEETGFVVAVERLAGVYSWAPRKDELIFSFVCRITGGERQTSDETDDVRFFLPASSPPTPSLSMSTVFVTPWQASPRRC